ELVGLRIVAPGAAAFASIRVTATAEAPWLSTTVAVTVKVPRLEYLCVAVALWATKPSPKSMVVRAIDPSGSDDCAAEAVMVRLLLREGLRTACGEPPPAFMASGADITLRTLGRPTAFTKSETGEGRLNLARSKECWPEATSASLARFCPSVDAKIVK